jgi:hypothetical protein
MSEATARALSRHSSSKIPPPIWFEIEAARILAIIEGLMPDLGGKKFAEDFKSNLKRQIANAFAEGQAAINQATRELTDEIKAQSLGAARVIRQEAQAVREAFSDTTGNNPSGDELDKEAEGKPDPTQSNSGGGQGS